MRDVLITGATGGIGRATALALLEYSDRVTVLCRNPERGEALRNALPAGQRERCELLEADLTRLEDVRRAAAEYRERGRPPQVLINNAAVVNTRRRLTADGFEEQFGVNHLAHYLLTRLLLDDLVAAAPARIVNVSSNAHHFVRGMDFDDLQAERRYRTFAVYGHSKLANLLFTRALDRRLQGTGVTVNAVHPGAVATGLGTQNGWLGKVLPPLLKPFMRTPEQGAATSVYVATAPELEGHSGGYYQDCRLREPKPWARDDAAAQRLWEISAELTGLPA